MKIKANTDNFTNYNIKFFIKFGGSLTNDINKCAEIIKVILNLENNRVIIFPGGGIVDNLLEDINKEFVLYDDVHHAACARAQDQTGLLLYNYNPDKLSVITKFSELEKTYKVQKIPILLPSLVIDVIDPFEKTWKISSDSMGAYFSYILEAETMIVFTNVDGIYNKDPLLYEDAKIIKDINVDDLLNMGVTSVDETFAKLLKNTKTNAYIINGNNIENLKQFFKGENSIYTKIIGDYKK